MNRNVLIVDDDEEFSGLLKGIFEQADYTVHAAVDAERAMEVIHSQSIGLVVMDQRLPGGMLGSDLLARFRQNDMTIPVIMVSGYLNDDAIRDLIRDGVEGVFIKPLNIFSLLKKASEILEKREKAAAGGTGTNVAGGSSGTVGHIEGLSERGQRFLERAREASGFKRNLLLIGPPGTLFEEIGRDIVGLSGANDHCVAFRPGMVTEEALEGLFGGDNAARPLALILLEAEKLSTGEVDQLITLVDQRGGASSSLRMIFCLSQTVEDLYDAGSIDEEFYLFLGTNELQVPPLKEMPEDLVAIARKEILAQSEKATFDMKLRTLLLEHDWPENMVELQSVIVRAVNLAKPLPPGVRHFEAALRQAAPSGDADARTSLERFLQQEKQRYHEALQILDLA